ncbi:unnamed protein product [Closterium sp. NIES-64]|nr:unnamed protein product [Closterium sp. NIES-64]
MGMALYRRAVLAASFPRPSAIRATAARLAPTARAGILFPFPSGVPPPSPPAALVCSPTSPPARHLHLPSSARSLRASLCAPRALAGIGGRDRQLLASARGGDRGAGIGAIRRVSIGAGGGAADAQLRLAEERDGGAKVVRASASGGAEEGKEGRGKGRGGKKSKWSYGAEHIQVLEGLEPVRRRPGMYIGSTGPRGLHHLVYEVVDNAIDEAQAGHASTVDVLLGADGSVCVTDNGRGTVPLHCLCFFGDVAGPCASLLVAKGMTSVDLKELLSRHTTSLASRQVLHAGGKFGGDSSGYRVSGGLHGVGVSVVNALSQVPVRCLSQVPLMHMCVGPPIHFRRACAKHISLSLAADALHTHHLSFPPRSPAPPTPTPTPMSPPKWLEARVWRDGQQYAQRFERGVPVGGMRVEEEGGAGAHEGDAQRTGTQIHFLPDPAVFTTTTALDFTTIAARLRELAFLNPQVVIHLKEEAGRSADFHFAGGLLEFVRWLNSEKTPMHEAQCVEEERDGVRVAVAWQWSGDAYSDAVVGYANSIRTSDGGTHIDGAKAAFTRTLNAAARKHRLLKEKEENLAGEHLREGLTCVVAVKVANPEFEGQTKTRLGNPGVRKVVDGVVSDALAAFLDANPAACEAILSKALDAYKAAEAAKKARELVRRKSVLKSAMLPGKLADCSCDDPAKSEVFIVEGDSAGGSTKQGRDRRLQAVLPLRGKILNVERKDDAAIYKNQELQNLILGLGLGLRGEEFDHKALRYHRIILLTDADVDGAHIRTLLLTFLFRYQRALFENGHVYVGVPPLYKVEVGRQAPVYCYSEAELQAHLRSLPASASPTIQRFKGLGEMMPAQLWETTLDPSQRRLKLITVEEAAQASVTLSVLMGDKVGPRKELIQTVGSRMAAAGMLDI